MIHSSNGAEDLIEPPLHGNQGDREPVRELDGPLALTVAVSRESGARGASIARRLGRKLDWQVYTHELLEFLCSNESARSHLLDDVPAEAVSWANRHFDRLRDERIINPDVELGEMPRLILTLAARGEIILVGRGAGYLLPRETTLHVRLVAPLEDRIAYMAQSLRLSPEDAAEQVRQRDEKREDFLVRYFNRRAGNANDYDLILNSYMLGEEICADLMHMAVRGKEHLLQPDSAF